MINRRHFLEHVGGLSALTACSTAFGNTFINNQSKLKNKSVILIWLGGGPPTIDMWDLKPNAIEGGPFKPISTTGDFQICEHLPELAKMGKDFSLIRSMSTREADHMRGTYYMHTAFKPTPTTMHPSIGSIVAFETKRPELEIPPFFSIGTQSIGGGFLGTAYNPFNVNSNGEVNNLGGIVTPRKLQILEDIEDNFIASGRGELPSDHKKLYEKVFKLNTSPQIEALKFSQEPSNILEAYGNTAFGRSALIARRLVQQGVPFVEVGFGGWDLHQTTHDTLSETKLPELDKVVSTLFKDLKRLDLWDNSVIMMMGEFGRTPRINQNAGRDHWAASWSAFIGGGLIKGGQAIGATSEDGKSIVDKSYISEDLLATVCKTLGFDLETTYTNKRGRPMRIVNGGNVIEELLA